jgi:PKD repeat protein
MKLLTSSFNINEKCHKTSFTFSLQFIKLYLAFIVFGDVALFCVEKANRLLITRLMRKIYSLLLLLIAALAVNAQANNVNFTFAPDPTTNNVVFTNTSSLTSDGPRKAFWYFGDGSMAITAALEGTAHHYASSGTYQVCLKIFKYFNNVNDSVLLGSECKTVTMQQQCTAGFQWADSITTNPLTHHVRFFGFGTNNANQPIKEVCWIFGDGTDTCILASAATPPVSLLNIRHKYTQNGTYNVCLKIKYEGSCVAEKCNTVVLTSPAISDSCRAEYLIQPVTATPLARKFVAQPWHSNNKKPVRICWTFGDGKDTCFVYPANYTGDYLVEHKYAQYGQYEACVIIKYDGGCEKRKCNLVSIIEPPTNECTATLNESPVNTVSLERKFYVGLMPNRRAEKICWNFGDGTDTCVILSNPINPEQLYITHRYPSPGNYSVCAKVYYVGSCIVQRCRAVEIIAARNNLCGGYMMDSLLSPATYRFKGTGVQSPTDYVLSYSWTFGDGSSASGQTVTHAYAAPGNYNVCLIIKTNSGCETRICKRHIVPGATVPQLILTPNPVANNLHAVFTSHRAENVTIKIYNANGLLVRNYTKFASAGINNWDFDVAALTTGIYSVIVQSTMQFATAIFFKQ